MMMSNKRRDFIKWRLGELGVYGEQSRLNFEEFLYIHDKLSEISRSSELGIGETVSMISEELDRTHVNVYYVERLTDTALNKIRAKYEYKQLILRLRENGSV